MEVAAGEKKDDDWIGEPGSAMRGEELRKLVLKRYGSCTTHEFVSEEIR